MSDDTLAWMNELTAEMEELAGKVTPDGMAPGQPGDEGRVVQDSLGATGTGGRD